MLNNDKKQNEDGGTQMEEYEDGEKDDEEMLNNDQKQNEDGGKKYLISTASMTFEGNYNHMKTLSVEFITINISIQINSF